jgi:hypothetical protein
MTKLCRTPNGTRILRPVQAAVLYEAGTLGGVLAAVRTGGGKAQPNTEPVLTPDGWKPIGAIEVGDHVIGSDGKPKRVVGTYPQGEREIYRVSFTDGSHTRCDLDHLWAFRFLNNTPKVQSLRDWLKKPLRKNVGGVIANTLRLRTVAPIERAPAELPIDPYTLGALLGDGCMTQGCISFTTMDRDIVEALVLPVGVTAKVTPSKTCGRATQYILTGAKGNKCNPLLNALRNLGLRGHNSFSKFIPPQYVSGSIAQRLAILQGLFDTDGHSRRAGLVEYCTTSADLATSVQDIVRSLGGTVSAVNDTVDKLAVRLNCKLPAHMAAFKCRRKLEHHEAGKVGRQREPKKCVKGVERQGTEQATCIAIDSPDQLYVTRDYILTHNTDISGLLPFVMGAKRPMLFVPAKLKRKTKLELGQLTKHWRIDMKALRIESYEKLGIPTHEKMLVDYEPDLIICDEAQALKHVDTSARARRMARFMKYFPACRFAAMSATLGDVEEFAHLLLWALRDGAPVPKEQEEIAVWAKVLTSKPKVWDFGAPADPAELVPHLGPEAIDYPQSAFRQRLVATPGVIVSVDKYEGAGLVIKPRYVDPSPEVEAAFADLRNLEMLPDGFPVNGSPFEQWHSARQLALGYYYMHDPRPPEPWRDVRRQYGKLVRTILDYSEKYDTEKMVRDGFESGTLRTEPYEPSPHLSPEIAWKNDANIDLRGLTLWQAWQKIEPTYRPKRYPVWLSESVVDNVEAWGKSCGGGIIWVDSVAFGKKLAERTGWGYFQNYGYDQRRRFIESDRVKSSEVAIASLESNKEGRNLQHKWHRNLFVDPPNKGDDHEQALSRTHRDGQPNVNVYADYLITCHEYYNSIYAAVAKNEDHNRTIGQHYRLLYADVVMPSLVGRKGEFTWKPNNEKKRNRVEDFL